MKTKRRYTHGLTPSKTSRPLKSTPERRQEAVKEDINQVDVTTVSQQRAVNSELQTPEASITDVEEIQRTAQDQIEEFTAARSAIQEAFQGESVPTDE